MLFKKIFQIAENQQALEIVNELAEEISKEKQFKAEVYKNEANKEIVINYSSLAQGDRATALSLVAGLANEEFDRAERAYCQQVSDNGDSYRYTLEGSSLAGALSQYAGLMSAGIISNYQVITYNSLGLENLLKFNGNEFLGYKIGLFYYLSNYLDNNRTMEKIYYDLLDAGVIKYNNISQQYRQGEKINSEKMKEVLTKILKKRLELKQEKASELVAANFNPLIIERKMRLIDRQQAYQARSKKEKDNLINYIISDNIPALLLEQTGSSYQVDQDLQTGAPALSKELIGRASSLDEDKLAVLTKPNVDFFQPYLLLKKDGNGR
jgi:hypothetical protein